MLRAVSGKVGMGSESGSTPHAFGVGDVVHEKYALKRDLGKRGVGTVFEAEHAFTGRRVALRLGATERLLTLARRLSAVRHPGIVDVLDAGPASPSRAYLSMELVEGRTLEGLLTTRGRLGKDDAVGIALQLCDALLVAHGRDVLHGRLGLRDVLVVREGESAERVKVVGFLAAATDQIERAHEAGEGDVLVEDADPRPDVQGIVGVLVDCLLGIRAYPLAPLAREERERLTVEQGEAVTRIVTGTLAPEAPIATLEALRDALEALGTPGRRTRVLVAPPVPPRPPAAAATGRRYRRGSYATPVRIVLPGGAILDGRSEDVSEGGLLVIAARDCPISQPLEVRFALPIEGKIVTVHAQAKWARSARPDQPEGPRALGIEFVELPDAARRSIARYVELLGDPEG